MTQKRKVSATQGAPSLNLKGVSNMWWLPEHDAELIPCLAKLADAGIKVDKNFKAEAYKIAAMKMNMKFKTSYTHLHVINRMKTWRNKINDMKACINISGADKRNSKLRGYINKSLPFYKHLQKIMGDDQATGDFVRPVYDKIGTNNVIPLDDDDMDIPLESEVEPQSDANTTPNSTSRKSQLESNTKPSSSKRPRHSNDDELIRSFVESILESIRNQHIIHWTEQLVAALKNHSDSYSEELLDKVLNHLYESERKARRFFIKTKEAQKRLSFV
ncbi:uncharacterized protein LOC109842075 [Asparagus officinalis]|uniref:uncharacterized protein LOC109842075 n=1 Tax=Asparagus officinalis TaxID=4686 RepID=UPI00098E8123|nr:uncharacterized protein LOC109842075 [Asparagus officinalis]